MSMLSAQADELRELALWLDDEFYDEYATRARDAADTILSLRDKAQELQAENAKLLELISELWVNCPLHDSDCDECRHKGGRTGCELYDCMLKLGVV